MQITFMTMKAKSLECVYSIGTEATLKLNLTWISWQTSQMSSLLDAKIISSQSLRKWIWPCNLCPFIHFWMDTEGRFGLILLLLYLQITWLLISPHCKLHPCECCIFAFWIPQLEVLSAFPDNRIHQRNSEQTEQAAILALRLPLWPATPLVGLQWSHRQGQVVGLPLWVSITKRKWYQGDVYPKWMNGERRVPEGREIQGSQTENELRRPIQGCWSVVSDIP